MPLNTRIDGDPNSIRTTATWLTARSGDTHDVGAQVYGARGDSESTWHGPASEGFRSTMTSAGQKIDELAEDLTATAGALRTHADDVDTAKSRMQQARNIAHSGGLTVNGDTIEDPGPAPADPAPLPADRPPTAAQQQAHDSATQAQSAHAVKVQKYQEATRVVVEARDNLNQSQSTLTKFISGYRDKAVFNITDIATGLTAGVAARTSNFRAAARAMDPGIQRAARYARNPRTNPFAQARADALEIERRLAKQAELNKAVASRTARLIDRLPRGVRDLLNLNLAGNLTPENISNPILRGSTRVLGKLPVVGLGITAAGVGYDINQGKDVTTSVASGAGGFVAGALATAAIASAGGPVGWAVAGGAVVSAGVGFVIEEWGDDIVEGAGDAADWAGDRIGDAGKAVGDFFGDLF